MPSPTTRRKPRTTKGVTVKRSRYVTTDIPHDMSRYSMVPYRTVNGKLEILTYLMFNKSKAGETSFSLGLPGIGILQKDLYTTKASNDYIGEISHKFPKIPVGEMFSIAVSLNASSEAKNLYTFVELPNTFIHQRNSEKPRLNVMDVDQTIGYMNNYLVNKYKNSATFYQYVFIDSTKLDLMFANSQVNPDANVLKADLKTLVHAMKTVQEIKTDSLRGSANDLLSITVKYDTVTLNKFITGYPSDIVKFIDYANDRVPSVFNGTIYETENVSIEYLPKMLKILSVLTKQGINVSTISSKLTENVIGRLLKAAENYPKVDKLFKDAFMNYNFRIEAENPFGFIYNKYMRTIPEQVKRKLNPHASEFVPMRMAAPVSAGVPPQMPTPSHTYIPIPQYMPVPQYSGPAYNSTGAFYPTMAAAAAADAYRYGTSGPAYNSTGAFYPTIEAAEAANAYRYGTRYGT